MKLIADVLPMMQTILAIILLLAGIFLIVKAVLSSQMKDKSFVKKQKEAGQVEIPLINEKPKVQL